jgi:hypothetical protein
MLILRYRHFVALRPPVKVGVRLQGPRNDDKGTTSSTLLVGSSTGKLNAVRISPRTHHQTLHIPRKCLRPTLLSTDHGGAQLMAGASITLHCGLSNWIDGHRRARPSGARHFLSIVPLMTT